MLAAAHSPTAPVTVSDFDACEGPDLFAPWMLDSNGQAIQFPAEVVGFRVRFWPPGARGPGELLEDDEGALFVPRNATPEEFRTLVGYRVGRYKLAALDASFQFNPRLPLVVVAITQAMADRAGAAFAPAAAPPPAASADVLAHVLALVKESNAHAQAMADRAQALSEAALMQIRESNARALEQVATLQRDAHESQRHTTTQLATVVGPVSGVLAAAGSSGLIKKTTALDAAAAGAPVTVQMAPSNHNEASPRNAASGAAASAASSAAAGGEKGGGMGEAAVMLLAPMFEKLGPVAAYGLARKLDVPEEYARSVAGIVETTAHTIVQMVKDDAPAAAPAAASPTVGTVARTGAELMAHLLEIQRALTEDDRAWVMRQMGARAGLVDALKPLVGALTLDEGARAVVAMHAMDRALTTPIERAWFDRVMAPDLLPQVFRNLFVTAAPEDAIAFVRERAAADAARAAAGAGGG
jgi:hypothetical protein